MSFYKNLLKKFKGLSRLRAKVLRKKRHATILETPPILIFVSQISLGRFSGFP